MTDHTTSRPETDLVLLLLLFFYGEQFLFLLLSELFGTRLFLLLYDLPESNVLWSGDEWRSCSDAGIPPHARASGCTSLRARA